MINAERTITDVGPKWTVVPLDGTVPIDVQAATETITSPAGNSAPRAVVKIGRRVLSIEAARLLREHVTNAEAVALAAAGEEETS